VGSATYLERAEGLFTHYLIHWKGKSFLKNHFFLNIGNSIIHDPLESGHEHKSYFIAVTNVLPLHDSDRLEKSYFVIKKKRINDEIARPGSRNWLTKLQSIALMYVYLSLAGKILSSSRLSLEVYTFYNLDPLYTRIIKGCIIEYNKKMST
jgi:hypothetical protein